MTLQPVAAGDPHRREPADLARLRQQPGRGGGDGADRRRGDGADRARANEPDHHGGGGRSRGARVM